MNAARSSCPSSRRCGIAGATRRARRDRTSGQYARAGHIRPIDHAAKVHRVAGPLNMPRGLTGTAGLRPGPDRPDTGRRFAARHAEAVSPHRWRKKTAQAFTPISKGSRSPRDAEHVLVLPGLSPVIAATEAEPGGWRASLPTSPTRDVGPKRPVWGHDFRICRSTSALARGLCRSWHCRGRTQPDGGVIVGLVRREISPTTALLAYMAGARIVSPRPARPSRSPT